MNTLEDYFKKFLIEQESEKAIDTIVDTWFNESTGAQMATVDGDSINNNNSGISTFQVFSCYRG